MTFSETAMTFSEVAGAFWACFWVFIAEKTGIGAGLGGKGRIWRDAGRGLSLRTGMLQTIKAKGMLGARMLGGGKEVRLTPLYVVGLAVVFAAAFSFVFDAKLDLNGDNCTYYMLSASISEGRGYSDISSGDYVATNVYPPGYPLLMSGVRMLSEGIVAQKVFNGLLLLGSAVLLFFFLRGCGLPESVAFAAGVVVLVNYQVLRFSTMMMSEMSFLFFSVLTLWFLSRDRGAGWQGRYFWLALLSAGYAYHIRTQGLGLIATVAGYYVFTRRWKEAGMFVAGFIVCALPWSLRNHIQHLGQSRYLDVISAANPWRPDAGELDVGGVLHRFVETLTMLATKAVPNTVMPYLSVNYQAGIGVGEVLASVALFALMVVGFWQLGRSKYFFVLYVLATFGVIGLFSAPSENRYITPLTPFLEVGLVVGLYSVLRYMAGKMGLGRRAVVVLPWVMLLLVGIAYPKLQELNERSRAPYPAAYRNFFAIAKRARRELPREAVICSRKPSLFYMFSRSRVSGYLWEKDDGVLIRDLIQTKTDYVVLDKLGYSSTALYLYPAIQKHPELFTVIVHLPNPDTYLLRFEREKAAREFQ